MNAGAVADGAPNDIIILGAGGTTLEALELLDALDPGEREYRCIGCLDDDAAKRGRIVGRVEVIGTLADAAGYPGALLVDAIGSPSSHARRERIVARACSDLTRFATLVHPRAWVSPSAQLGRGAMVLAGAVVGPESMIGDHVTILPNAVVNHGVRIGDWTLVASGVTLSGDVTVGCACYIGAGSHVIQRARIGDEALVGMGSVVLHDVEPADVVVGNPARVLRRAGANREQA
jgi:sugar O-acyltransferase (sialic acid O-acetyltransferase NeuD family)